MPCLRAQWESFTADMDDNKKSNSLQPFLLSHVRELNLVFVGVQDTRDNVFAFAKGNGIPENRVYYGGYGGPVKHYRVQALPTTLVLCPGKDLQAVLGEITEERLPLLSCPTENPR
jgi:hypothetical protein